MLHFLAKKIFGSVNDRIIKELSQDILKINNLESEISSLSDDELKNKTQYFKDLLNNKTLDDILHEAFAVVREAAKRTLKMRHFDVQLIGGIVLHRGKISEMKTGEGKTLVATLPCYLNALTNKGVHIVTVNDYLAQRDSEWMGKIFNFLGLDVGCITSQTNEEDRKKAYNCDITYATNNELGFDLLRDNMKYNKDDLVQRGHNFAIIDEVDSILIDEARTPLIISGPTQDNSKLYYAINNIIPELTEQDYQFEEKDKNIFLSESGMDKVEEILRNRAIIAPKSSLYEPNNIKIIHHINQALKAHKTLSNEIDYIVKDSQIIIIDEFTGRMQEGRRFSDGLHQALEAKEGLDVRNENQTLASITYQNYFRLYKKLAGMTGTAMTESIEFEEIYKLNVVEIPTNNQISRIDEDDEIYKNINAKFSAIINSIKEAHEKSQPILVGTVSIEKSEYISKLLKKEKLPHKVLNAKYHEQEAEIIEQAGTAKAITIATNMAGRGTDIMLGGNAQSLISKLKNPTQEEINEITNAVEQNKQQVIAAGGLYVLGTERHESRRIDNQLRGRSGRQGDIGKTKFFLSLEDDLMRIFGSEKLQGILSTLGLKEEEAIHHPWITKTLESAQKKVEGRNYEIRKNLLKFDDVINQQRKNIFKLRNKIMESDNISPQIKKYSSQIIEDIVDDCIDKNSFSDQWEMDLLQKEVQRIYGLKLDLVTLSKQENINETHIKQHINDQACELFASKDRLYSAELMRYVEKQLFLATIDSMWKYHLLSLDKLKYGINLRAYAQKDPLIEYKKEAFALFEDMMLRIEEQIVMHISFIKITDDSQQINILSDTNDSNIEQSKIDPIEFTLGIKKSSNNKQSNNQPRKLNIDPSERDPNDPSSWGNIGRNQSCPCGSGKKYKQCHGKI
jgi:preprotein translocase subunit SecA|tara:strand:- start:1459 stop:4173 length:2715 start_codon:yes stop_codon:yes gene_type:complete